MEWKHSIIWLPREWRSSETRSPVSALCTELERAWDDVTNTQGHEKAGDPTGLLDGELLSRATWFFSLANNSILIIFWVILLKVKAREIYYSWSYKHQAYYYLSACYIAQIGLKFMMVPMHHPSKCLDDKNTPPHPASSSPFF